MFTETTTVFYVNSNKEQLGRNPTLYMDKKVGVFICALKWKPDYSEKPGNLGCE